MKINQQQKAQNRKAVIRAAVDLVSEKGYRAATMRGIAKAAEMGEATIYNYFPTKEAIVFAYFEDHMADCIEALKQVESFNTFSLQEQLQALFGTSLDLFLADREFVSHTFRMVLLGGSRDWSRVKPIRAAFLSAVNDMLAAAAEVGEIPDQVFQELMGQFFLDAYIAAVLYWLADTSDGFGDTTVLMDRGLDLACALLKAGIANKIFDMAVFLFKTHVLTKAEYFIEPFKRAGKIKRRFMETMDEK
jgi:AcrR family transcriptional regulator